MIDRLKIRYSDIHEVSRVEPRNRSGNAANISPVKSKNEAPSFLNRKMVEI